MSVPSGLGRRTRETRHAEFELDELGVTSGRPGSAGEKGRS